MSKYMDIVAGAQKVYPSDADVVEVVRCEDCIRNADNGGLYDDGRTKCPIQEHYALLKDGFCYLGERKEQEHK